MIRFSLLKLGIGAKTKTTTTKMTRKKAKATEKTKAKTSTTKTMNTVFFEHDKDNYVHQFYHWKKEKNIYMISC